MSEVVCQVKENQDESNKPFRPSSVSDVDELGSPGNQWLRVRYYDEYHSDYHYWNGDEDRAYHRWLAERHYEYRDYAHLNREQQRDYWNWRHEHPDNGR